MQVLFPLGNNAATNKEVLGKSFPYGNAVFAEVIPLKAGLLHSEVIVGVGR